ncbi:hypothetical protein VK792_14940 [Mesobacterium sp. TK19101]|uniref:Uncharacterized protein n=1 Tax=Mesobacterium hydrothermale TaxID=3111907 RepID=A0ABU6HKE4_9RHOB|nr:hypothetical protein [Mesobacterium sp. TK19101]MEC3862587.1 hypothetical protein [Mesobacterium sp. TK19101]
MQVDRDLGADGAGDDGNLGAEHPGDAARDGGDHVGSGQDRRQVGGAWHLDHRVGAASQRLELDQETRPEAAAIVHHHLRRGGIGIQAERTVCQRVCGVEDADVILGKQGATVISRLFQPDRADQHVAFAADQLVAPAHLAWDHVQPQARRVAPEPLDQFRQDRHPFIIVARDHDVLADPGRVEHAGRGQRFEFVQHPGGLGRDFSAAFGWYDPAALPYEKRVAENLAQPGDGVADAGLADPQRFCRAGKRTVCMYHLETAQRREVERERIGHGYPYRKS